MVARAFALLCGLLAAAAAAQQPAPAAPAAPAPLQLAIRRASHATTGFNPAEIDSALRQALAAVALEKGADVIFAREYEADIVVMPVGQKAEHHYELVFFLETTTVPVVRDALTVDFERPGVGNADAEKVVQLLVLRARALKAQGRLQSASASSDHAAHAPGGTGDVPTVVAGAIPRPPDEVREEMEQLLEQGGPSARMKVREETPRHWGLVDAAVSGGLNAPVGTIGGRVELHAGDFLGVTAAFGYGSWGPRVSPGLRVYPFGLHTLELFAEAALGISLGEAASVRHGGVTDSVQLKQSLTLMMMLGLRQGFLEYFTADVFLGYGALLSGNNYSVDAGTTVDASLRDAIDARQPQGLIVGAAVGVSLF